jgi:low temperature requirement protein LtrA
MGLTRFVGLFLVIWWVWVMFSTYSDRFGTDDVFHRGALLLAMLLSVGLAASVPGAFAGHAAPFAIAYVLLKGEQLVLFERARRQVPAVRSFYGRFAVVGLLSLALWATSAVIAGPARYVLWGVAIAAEMATPWLSISAAKPAPLSVSHIPERFGVFVLIVLGESVRRIVTAASHRPWTIPLVVVLAAAFATIAAMWWISFNTIDHAAARRSRTATLAYIYTQLPMVAGIAATSAGLYQAVLAASGAGHVHAAPRVAIYGGVALYLLAASAAPGATPNRARRIRLGAALASLGLIFVGAILPALSLIPALALVLVAEISLDRRRPKDKPSAAATLASRSGPPATGLVPTLLPA